MTDDERRAEIEAARELLRAWDARELSHPEHPATHREWAAWMNESAGQLRAALDRVRDARDDDAASRSDSAAAKIALAFGRSPQGEAPMQSDDQIEEPMDYSPIRSPQGEGHETVRLAAKDVRTIVLASLAGNLTRTHLVPLVAALDAVPDRVRDARGDDECRINLVSSRMCERGTKSCEVEHRSPQSEDHETDAHETTPDDPAAP